jgi:tetratricopeptide (TPR) repeat protein
VAISERLLAVDASLELDAARIAWARAAVQFCYLVMLEDADRLLARIASVGGPAAAPPHVAGYIYEALAVRGDEVARIELGGRAIAAFEAAGDERNACNLRIVVSFGLNELGAYARSMPLLRTTLVSAERLGLHNVQATASIQLGLAMCALGELGAAEELCTRALRACRAQGNRLMEAATLSYLGTIALARGDVTTADHHVQAALAVVGDPWISASVEATRARVRLAQGAPDEALVAARTASAAMAKAGERTTRKGLVRLVLAEALRAVGREDEAREALRDARARILTRAAELDEPLRAAFLGVEPENVRTLAWATEGLDARPHES